MTGPSGQPPGDDEKTVWIPPNPNVPPAGPPYYQQQPPPVFPANSGGGQWKWIAVGIVAVLVIVGSVLAVVMSGGSGEDDAASSAATTPTTPAPGGSPGGTATTSVQTTAGQPPATTPGVPRVEGDGLSALLLTEAELGDRLKTPVQVVSDGTNPLEQQTDRPDCSGILIMPSTVGLEDSNFTEIRIQLLGSPPDAKRTRVLQWAIAFPDGPAAASYLANEYQQWDKCRFKTVSLTENGRTAQWTIPVPQLSPSGTQLTVIAHQQGADDWWCSQTGVARSNVVVGAQVCQAGSPGNSLGLAGAMGMKVPR